MYLAYYLKDQNQIILGHEDTSFDVWDISTVIWDGADSGTTDARFYRDRFGRAVHCTGPAFHAGIAVVNLSFSALDHKNAMRANLGASFAACTLFSVEL